VVVTLRELDSMVLAPMAASIALGLHNNNSNRADDSVADSALAEPMDAVRVCCAGAVCRSRVERSGGIFGGLFCWFVACCGVLLLFARRLVIGVVPFLFWRDGGLRLSSCRHAESRGRKPQQRQR
jgi:hypothetical protein